MKKFEFILRINGNIICQRFFSVKKFNPNVVQSIDMIDCVDECVYIVKQLLKTRSVEFLWSQYNPYEKQTKEQINRTPIWEKEDVFDFEIRIDEKTVSARRFTGNIYPQRVRYSVDIREIIPRIISTIQETLGSENISVEYVTTNS
jgi:hypothetical protein